MCKLRGGVMRRCWGVVGFCSSWEGLRLSHEADVADVSGCSQSGSPGIHLHLSLH